MYLFVFVCSGSSDKSQVIQVPSLASTCNWIRGGPTGSFPDLRVSTWLSRHFRTERTQPEGTVLITPEHTCKTYSLKPKPNSVIRANALSVIPGCFLLKSDTWRSAFEGSCIRPRMLALKDAGRPQEVAQRRPGSNTALGCGASTQP